MQIEIFEEHAAEYDEWYDEHQAAYNAEILALRSLIPSAGTGLEVGAGTGRFTLPPVSYTHLDVYKRQIRAGIWPR